MRMIRVLRQRLRSLLRRSRAESDLEREIALHLAMLEKEHGSGAAARREFGSASLVALWWLAGLIALRMVRP